jgi:predicted transposase YbfD/YdcC
MAAELQFDNVDSILTCFEELKDPRSHVNRLHVFGDLLVICIMAVIAGADGPQAIGIWADNNQVWLKKHLKLHNGIPSHDTLGRLLAALKPIAFQACFQAWIETVAPLEKDDTNQIAIDGKVLRRSHDRSKGLGPLWLVSAWANEITAIPELLDNIEIKGAVVTIDAAGCQREIAKKIIDGEGDYVFSLKGNQGKLYDGVTNYVTEHMENDLADIPARRYVQTLRGHGRVDEITYYQMPVPKDLVNLEKWSGLRTIGVAIRQSESGSKSSTEVRFFITSIPMGVKKFARYVRGHWAIENTLHWCLDVTFREDENRVRERTTANNMAWLKRFGLSMLKQQSDKYSIAMRRRVAGWNLDYLAKVLGIPVL